MMFNTKKLQHKINHIVIQWRLRLARREKEHFCQLLLRWIKVGRLPVRITGLQIKDIILIS